MNTERPAAPPTQPLARPGVGGRLLSSWWLRRQQARLTVQILALQRLLAEEFATLDTEPLHDDLAALCRRRAAIEQRLAGQR